MYKTLALLWTCLVVVLPFISGETYESFIARTAPELCPYSTFCTQGPTKRYNTKNNNNTSPCCSPCSCKEDCWQNDNCCPDFPSRLTTTPKAFIKCMIPIQFISKVAYDAELFSGTAVYTVISCPAKYPVNEVSKKCARKIAGRNLRDLATVSDKSGRVYKNRYCAKCHGVLDIDVWEQAVACRPSPEIDILKLITTLDPEALQLAGCVLYSVAPESDTLIQRSRCYDSRYTTCNVTGQWEMYDEYTERACAAYTASFGNRNLRLATTAQYRNPYCFLCNKYDGDKVGGKCPRENTDVKSYSFTITSLLTQGKKPRSSQSTKCSSDEIYDRYFDSCRILNCPLGQEAVDGRCHDMFSYIEGAEIMAVFIIKQESTDHNTSLSTILSDMNNLLKIHTVISNILKPNSSECIPCPSLMVEDKLYTDRFLVHFAYRSKKSCPIKTILDIFHGAYTDGMTFTLLFEGEPFSFKGRIVFDKYIPMLALITNDRYEYALTRNTQNPVDKCLSVDVLKDGFYCPFVDLSMIEYQHLMNDSTTDLQSDDFNIITNEIGHETTESGVDADIDSTYRICTGKYFPDKAVANDAAIPASVSFVYFVVLLKNIV